MSRRSGTVKRQIQKHKIGIRNGMRCCFCDAPLRIPMLSTRPEGALKSQKHHLRHRCYGGTDDIKNMRLICKVCHRNYHHLFDLLISGHKAQWFMLKWLFINLLFHYMYSLLPDKESLIPSTI